MILQQDDERYGHERDGTIAKHARYDALAEEHEEKRNGDEQERRFKLPCENVDAEADAEEQAIAGACVIADSGKRSKHQASRCCGQRSATPV